MPFLRGRVRRPSGPLLIAALGAALGVALGAVSITLLRPFTPAPGSGMISLAAPFRSASSPAPSLSEQAITARVEPSVVDVTAALTYDDETASGTGFVIDPRLGLVLTNNHVIRGATAVRVRVTATGQSYQARIVGVDVPADIAVLQIKAAAGLTAAPLGHSATLTAGSQVVSFGNQAGAGGLPVAAAGVITSTSQTIKAADGTSRVTETLSGMLAVTARIEPGDSGGPLADSAGTVVGVDTATGTSARAGFAIPIDVALTAERQIAAGHPGPGISLGTGGFLGVLVGPGSASSPAAQQQAEEQRGAPASGSACASTEADAGVPSATARATAGALVLGVLCDTGAASAGLVPGDVVTSVANQPVTSPDALVTVLQHCQPGSVVSVTWVAATGARRSASIRLSPAPAT